MFVPGKPSRLSILFLEKARAYPRVVPFSCNSAPWCLCYGPLRVKLEPTREKYPNLLASLAHIILDFKRLKGRNALAFCSSLREAEKSFIKFAQISVS